jgi:hypothetical protein
MADEDDFRASDLIGSAGVGQNGEKLVQTLDFHYPEALQAALLRRENAALTRGLSDADRASVAKIAGVDHLDGIKVRGGERSSSDAYVTYAYLDDRGEVVKGCLPYDDLGKSSSDGHVSQRDSILNSPAAQAHLAAQAKARAAGGGSTGQVQRSGDPVADYEEMKAPEVVALLEAHPERAAAVEALERATRPGDERKTVLAAVEDARSAPEPDDEPEPAPAA